jgi:hypothetical protein
MMRTQPRSSICLGARALNGLEIYRSRIRGLGRYVTAEREMKLFRGVVEELVALDRVLASHRELSAIPTARENGQCALGT